MIGEVFALDYDDCFKPMTRPFLKVVYDQTGVELKPEDAVVGKYHFDEAFPNCDISADEFTELIDLYMLKHSVDVEPFPDAVAAVSQIMNICDVHIVTARDKKHEDVTLQSIERYIGLERLKGVHVIGSSDGSKKTVKTDTYLEISATSTADDADHNINAAVEAGLTGFSVQYSGLFHGGYNLDKRAIVVRSLSEVLKYADISVG